MPRVSRGIQKAKLSLAAHFFKWGVKKQGLDLGEGWSFFAIAETNHCLQPVLGGVRDTNGCGEVDEGVVAIEVTDNSVFFTHPVNRSLTTGGEASVPKC